jgi:YfiR/HmsC-like
VEILIVGARLPRTIAYRAGLSILVACVVVLLPSLAAQGQSGSLEYAVKATYLYKFVPFVEWPPAAFDTPSSPVNLCIALYDPFGEILDRVVSGQRIGERPILVRRLQTVDRQSGCHIMYIGNAGAPAVAEVLETVRGTSVLTVTDSVGDARIKGVINFIIESHRVRFEIDNQAAAENGLVISSKLLSLAVSVKPRA